MSSHSICRLTLHSLVRLSYGMISWAAGELHVQYGAILNETAMHMGFEQQVLYLFEAASSAYVRT
jgi:hypothetical protein